MDFSKFDHSKSSLAEALYTDQKEIDDFNLKLKGFTKECIKNNVTKTSEVVEKLLPEFSYNELVLISSKFFVKIIKDFNEVEKDSLLDLLRKLKEK